MAPLPGRRSPADQRAERDRRPTRSRLLYALDLVDELCVGDLALALEVDEDAAGHGLRVLRTAGLVACRHDGRVLYYRLATASPSGCDSTA